MIELFNVTIAFIGAFASMVLLMPVTIAWQKKQALSQVIRTDGPTSHFAKGNTPTGGGVIIIAVWLFWSIVCGEIDQWTFQLVLASTVWFALIGLSDDYLKLYRQSSTGLAGRWKMTAMLLGAFVVAWILIIAEPTESAQVLRLAPLDMPVFNLGSLSLLFYVFLIVGSSNAVNLTDGLDGLAIFPACVITAALGIMIMLLPNQHNELVVICAAFCGCGLGFLWFNAHPAQIFMGDVGSLAIGSMMALLAILIHQELWFGWMSIVFVVETLSVMIQVLSFKLTNKRVFLMSPIHHHFELKGVSESKIITRAWLITVVMTTTALLIITAGYS